MPTVVNTPLQSQYGFESPSFVVDNAGNITARSITLEVVDDTTTDVAADIAVTEVGGNFRIDAGTVDNAGITLYRNTSKSIDLTLTTLTFSIFSSVGGTLTLYNDGVKHNDGTIEAEAQGKNSGRLFVALPSTAPDVLYYGNATGTIYGTITVLDPSGLFGDMQITGGTESSSILTGALTVAGGVGIAKDLYIGGSLNVAGVGIPRLESPTNLELEAANKIILQIDNVTLGELNSAGLAATINNSTIDNTVIGGTTPATAAFTSATVVGIPASNTSITNKEYVDGQALSLAIAFGL